MGLFGAWRRDAVSSFVCVKDRRHDGPCELLPMPRPRPDLALRRPDRETLVARSVTVSAVEISLQRGLPGVVDAWPPGEAERRFAARHFAFFRWLVGEHRLSDWAD